LKKWTIFLYWPDFLEEKNLLSLKACKILRLFYYFWSCVLFDQIFYFFKESELIHIFFITKYTEWEICIFILVFYHHQWRKNLFLLIILLVKLLLLYSHCLKMAWFFLCMYIRKLKTIFHSIHFFKSFLPFFS